MNPEEKTHPLWKSLLELKDIEKKHVVDITDCTKTGQLPAVLNYLSLDLARLDFSLFILYPKPHFLLWLQSVLDAQGKGTHIKNIYFPEEDGVWLIPARFHWHQHFQAFIACLKPIILKRELGKWGPGELMPPIISAETFDEFFDFHIRDQAVNSLEFIKL